MRYIPALLLILISEAVGVFPVSVLSRQNRNVLFPAK